MKLINLYEYQKKYYEEIVNHLSKNPGAILAMDTGMGKTYVATRLIQDMINVHPEAKILVLVRKKNLSDPWGNLFSETLLSERNHPLYFTYSRNEAIKLKPNKDSIADFSDYNIILTNYEILTTNIDDFRFRTWDLIVYDEIHDRDSKTKEQIIFKTLSNLNVNKQLSLTASPLRNSIKELYFLYKFTMNNKTIANEYRKLLSIENKFLEMKTDELYMQNGGMKSEAKCRIIASYYFEKKLADILKPFIGNGIFYHSKRDKDIPPLPPLVNRNIFLPLHYSQSYQNFHSQVNFNLYDNNAIIIETSPAAAQSCNKIQLSNACLGISTKEIFTAQLVNYIIESSEDKIVIFSQFTRTLSYFLRKLSSFGCTYIEGKTKDYLLKIKEFSENPNKRIILVSLDAYKEGIDLRCANHVIFLDLPYNPQILIQAKDRCHRTGQKSNVFVYYLFYNSDYSPDKSRKYYLTLKTKLFDYLFGTDQEGNRLPELIVEDYTFLYKSDFIHAKDIYNNYNNFKTTLKEFFEKEKITYQFPEYDTSTRNKFNFDTSNLRVEYSKCKEIKKETPTLDFWNTALFISLLK